MRALERNKQVFWYANPTGTQTLIDDYGNECGTAVVYSEPVSFKANISAARGTAELDEFGINENYTKTIVTDDLTLPVEKSSVLWIDREPNESGTVSHNFVVVAVAKSLNSLTIAVKEVNVSAPEQVEPDNPEQTDDPEQPEPTDPEQDVSANED